jgi:hypothetical protein
MMVAHSIDGDGDGDGDLLVLGFWVNKKDVIGQW